MKKQKLKQIDKIIQKYMKKMQLEMKRFANEIMRFKFEEDLG